MVLRKQDNEDLKLIMIRVIAGHSAVLRQSIGFGQVEVKHFPPEFDHFHFFFMGIIKEIMQK